MAARSIQVHNLANGRLRRLTGVVTIGDVKVEIERTMDVPSESYILVGRTSQTVIIEHDVVVNTQPGLTLLPDNDLVLNTKPEITLIDIYTKIDPPRPVEIYIIHTGSLVTPLTISSDQTVADLRREIDQKLPITIFPRRLTTLQAAISKDDAQLCEYLPYPLPERSRQMIMVEELPLTNVASYFRCCNIQ